MHSKHRFATYQGDFDYRIIRSREYFELSVQHRGSALVFFSPTEANDWLGTLPQNVGRDMDPQPSATPIYMPLAEKKTEKPGGQRSLWDDRSLPPNRTLRSTDVIEGTGESF
ncbi:hypothetical protein NDU88_011308 [Pleurodeles waltl]|uniref:Uncharacterized protein n=1 Tax=Pleurodeles waltl TaxID=8319 RepID=A0AAV7R111_PLEWA|nr:hypothetical protein NDU88_011308 [Pleurodeles waltl]